MIINYSKIFFYEFLLHFKPLTVLRHAGPCLYASACHNPTQDVTMATAAAWDEPSYMECTVCHEHFTLPKLLPCGHLLCRHCLVTWLKSQPEVSCLSAAALSWILRSGRVEAWKTSLTVFPLTWPWRLWWKPIVCCLSSMHVACVSTWRLCPCVSTAETCSVNRAARCTRNSRYQNITRWRT